MVPIPGSSGRGRMGYDAPYVVPDYNITEPENVVPDTESNTTYYKDVTPSFQTEQTGSGMPGNMPGAMGGRRGFTTDPTTGYMVPIPGSSGRGRRGFTTDPTTGIRVPKPGWDRDRRGNMPGGAMSGNGKSSKEHSRIEREISLIGQKMDNYFSMSNKQRIEEERKKEETRKAKEGKVFYKIYAVIHQKTRIKLNICLNNNMGIAEICEGVEGIDFSLGNSDNNFILKFENEEIVYNLENDMLYLNNDTLLNEHKSFKIIKFNDKEEKYRFFNLNEKHRIGDQQHQYPVCVLVTEQNPNVALQIIDANYKNVFYLKNINDLELRQDYNFYKSFIFHLSDKKAGISYSRHALNTMTEEHNNNVQDINTYITANNNEATISTIQPFRNVVDLNPREHFTNSNKPLTMTEENFKKTQNQVNNNKEQIQCEQFDPSKHYKRNNIPCRGCNFK